MSERSKVAEIQIGTDIYEVQSKSVENQNTAIGAFTDKYDWVGTQAEYQALKDNDEIPDNWVCFITDDINTTTGVLDLTNYVRKDIAETINGTKTLVCDDQDKALYTKTESINKAVAPSQTKYSNFIDNLDISNNLLSRIYTQRTPAENNGIFLQAWADDNTTNYSLGIDSAGNTFAPSCDSENSIVTTTDILKTKNGYCKLGNGLIIQWGETPRIETAGQEVLLPTPFTTANYSVVATYNDENSGVYTCSCYNLTTTSFQMRSGYYNKVYNFIAIGY